MSDLCQIRVRWVSDRCRTEPVSTPSEPRCGPAGCGPEETGAEGEKAAFKASARRTRQSVLSRLQKAHLLCSRNKTDWRICTDEKLPSPSTLLQPEPWLPAEWFTTAAGKNLSNNAALGRVIEKLVAQTRESLRSLLSCASPRR